MNKVKKQQGLYSMGKFSENLKKIGEGAFFQVHSGLYVFAKM